MKKHVVRLALIAAAILLVNSARAQQSRDEAREEFQQVYALAADGRVSLENINGPVRIQAWERNEIKVQAVKRAYTRARLEEARIEIDAHPDAISIKTKYPDSTLNFNNNERRYENPATVEYTLTVPRRARLESIELVNGRLDVEGVAGDVRAACVNGTVNARGLIGEVNLSTVNGALEASFNQLSDGKSVSLNSVNGQITVTLPSDSNATIKATTISGPISNDFGLTVRDGDYVGHELSGALGRGGARVRLSNVNGRIAILRAADGRQQSSVTNLSRARQRDANERDSDQSDSQREVRRTILEAQRAAAQAQRAIVLDSQRAALKSQRAQIEAQREASRTAARVEIEVNRAVRDRVRDKINVAVNRNFNLVRREEKSFAVTGVPRVSVETFDGAIVVRVWDKSEVAYTAIKRATSEDALRRIELRAEQRGAEINIVSAYDKSSGVARSAAATNAFVNNASVSLIVHLPRNTNLRVTSGDGRLTVNGIAGELELRTGDGSIEVRNGRGRLRANSGDGRIIVFDFDGEVEARTNDGSITLDGRFSQLSALTDDGSILLALPASLGAIIETNAEDVVNQGLTISEETNPARSARRWRVGRGGPLFILRTGDGRVILRDRARSTQQDE